MKPRPRVLIVAHYASERVGGEASIPLRLFDRLSARGVPCWLVTHELYAEELAGELPSDQFSRVTFVPSLPGFSRLQRLGPRLPPALRTLSWGVSQLERQKAMLPVARRLVTEHGIDVVHQPVSVSPVIPSPMVRLGAPVVIGPLNGGMELPSAFRERDSLAYRLTKRARPAVAGLAHRWWRGRIDAAAVLVANERTARLLPSAARVRAEALSDIGVVLGAWPVVMQQPSDVTRYLFLGRLVSWKGVDVLLDAFTPVARQVSARLDIAGDGPERARLQAQARRLGISEHVRFHGWLSPAGCAELIRKCDVFVSASLQESGGVAVLEAMATGRPVIATDWGGLATTVTGETGIHVGVGTVHGLRQDFTDAMLRLARDPELRQRLGAAARRRVEQHYDWDLVTDRLLDIYHRVTAGATRTEGPGAFSDGALLGA